MGYTHALPATEACTPFILVLDVGTVIECDQRLRLQAMAGMGKPSAEFLAN